MKTITYNLKGEFNNGNYYNLISSFTDFVLSKSNDFLSFFIDDLLDFVKLNSKWYASHSIKDINLMKSELSFESLLLANLWINYSKKAFNFNSKSKSNFNENFNEFSDETSDESSNMNFQKIMANLSDFRNNLSEDQSDLKNEIDEIRGYFGTILFFNYFEEIANYELSLDNLKILFDYLKATGEFSYELKHLNYWIDYLSSKSIEFIENILCEIIKFSKWFNEYSKIMLSTYIPNLNNFINYKLPAHINKEDFIFCSRDESDYYLNMLGAEIMNRIFKSEFESRPRKAVLLPSCMKIANGKNFTCSAKEKRLGYVCNMCNSECNVCKIAKKGLKENFETYIVSHESTAFSKATEKDKEELAIVGVACILNLISGGWKAESLGIPAQCVILDYVGCSNHWADESFPTEINLDKLNEVLSSNY